MTAWLTIAPSRVTQQPTSISSVGIGLELTRPRRAGPRSSRYCARRGSSHASGIEEAGFVIPCTTTSPCSTSMPGCDSSQLPPWSAARSTTTEPGFIPSTIAVVTRMGALRPGTAAVVMTTSEAITSFPISSRWRARNSSDCSRA